MVSLIDATSKFLDELSIDIQNMNRNIDHLIQSGHEHVLRQLDKFNSASLPSGIRGTIQDIPYKEIPNG